MEPATQGVCPLPWRSPSIMRLIAKTRLGRTAKASHLYKQWLVIFSSESSICPMCSIISWVNSPTCFSMRRSEVYKIPSFVLVQSPSYVQLFSTMDCSTPGLPVPHHLPESTQVHIHCVSDAMQPSHPLISSSPSALHLSQHQGLFQ